jgi:hypothetical protein
LLNTDVSFEPEQYADLKYSPIAVTMAPKTNVVLLPNRSEIPPDTRAPAIAPTWIMEFHRASHIEGMMYFVPTRVPKLLLKG